MAASPPSSSWVNARHERIETHPLAMDLDALRAQQEWLMTAALPSRAHIALVELCVQVSVATRDGLPSAEEICTRRDWDDLAAAQRLLRQDTSIPARALVSLIESVQQYAMTACGHSAPVVLGVPARPRPASSVRAQLFGSR